MHLISAIFAIVVLVVSMLGSAHASPISFRDLLARPRELPDKTIVYGAHAHQFGELWLPKGGGPYRTVILIHGGCWLAELPGTELMAYLAQDLRARGYAVWNVDYRRIGDEGGGYPGTFLDAGNAVDLLQKLAPQFHLDLSKVAVLGHSAGGHLASWVAGRAGLPKSSRLRVELPLKINGVVSLAGINDLERYRDMGPSACGGAPTIDELVGAKDRVGQDVYADTSPMRLLPIHAQQVVVSAELDKIVPPQFGVHFAAAGSRRGDEVTERTYKGAGHFELIDPTSAAWSEIRIDIDMLTR